ncbi:MAG: tetratricopeptide repeat protein [Bacteroidales bacterium]
MRYFLIFIVIISASLWRAPSVTAANLDFATIDRLTYNCYLDKKWDSVITVGKQALRLNIDYYYLRVRMGIAYYEKKEYFPAITHLNKARQFNSSEPYVKDYLNLAYHYSNPNESAQILRSTMPPGGEAGPSSIQRFVDQVHVESGYTLSSDRSPENLDSLTGTDRIYGERDLYGNSFYSNVALKLRISKRVGLTLAYNYLNFNKTKYYQFGRAEGLRDSINYTIFFPDTLSKNYFYSFPWKVRDTSFSYNVVQQEGYISATVLGPWGVKITPAVHFIRVGYPVITPQITDSVSDTAFYSYADNTYHMFTYPSVRYTFSKNDSSFNNWLVSLALSRDFGRFNIELCGSWSNLNNKKQKQAGLSLTWYPFGNLDFYGTTSVTGFFQKNDKRVLLSQVLGVKITPWMWGEANFYYGDYTNANIFNGAVVYNNSDIIDYRGGATLVFLAGKHLRMSLIYQFFRKESTQYYYNKTEDPDTHKITEIPQTKNNPYNTHTIIGGITWKL